MKSEKQGMVVNIIYDDVYRVFNKRIREQLFYK